MIIALQLSYKRYMKKTVLPINATPSLRTCIHYAYPCAIIESKELASIYIDGFNRNEWNVFSKDALLQYQEESVAISLDGCDPNAVLWRKCEQDDEVSALMDYIKYTDQSAYVDIFLFTDDLEEEICLEDKNCGVRWNPFGFFVKKNMHSFDTKEYKYSKLTVEKGKIQAYASIDGNEWSFVDLIDLPESFMGKQLNIGIHFHFGPDYFEMWKKMNLIQLVYNPDNPYKGIYLDYYLFPRKNVDNSYGFFPDFLDTDYEVLYDIIDGFGSLHNYIKYCIQHRWYVELCLDEFYVEKRKSYQKNHFDHFNLFYGYDDNRRVFYIMGYGDDSKPTISEFAYEFLDRKIVHNENVLRYRFHANDITPLRFSLSSILNSLSDLTNGFNSSARTENLLAGEKLIYGVAVFDALLSPQGVEKVREDKRISYCLNEHAKLMKERLKFLCDNNYLDANSFEYLDSLCDRIINTTYLLLLQVLKNKIKHVSAETIKAYVIEISIEEKRFFNEFFERLKANNPLKICQYFYDQDCFDA